MVGASSGGGGGSPVDPTTVLATGDIKPTYGTGVLTGFVRLNGRTIGSATSGATERANSDTQALFVFLWNSDSSLAVSGGRGASAAADWSANKTIALPDFRSRAMAGLADMGTAGNSIFAGATFTTGNPTTLGATIGSSFSTITTSNLPAYNLGFSLAWTQTGGGLVSGQAVSSTSNFGVTSGGFNVVGTVNLLSPSVSVTGTIGGTISSGGGNTALQTISPLVLVTLYIKL